MKQIILKGVRQHNLKNIDVEIKKGSITCVSGPSGAGKSSLVFDTIYAEAQRRYIETFSPYARQFLERLPRPDADEITNLQAAISITQQNPVKNSRSTVATLTELTHSVRMLFFRNGTPWCPNCQIPLKKSQPEEIIDLFKKKAEKGLKRAWFTIPISKKELPHFKELGFQRLIYRGKQVEIDHLEDLPDEIFDKELLLVVERFSLKSFKKERIVEAIKVALELGSKKLTILFEDGSNILFFQDVTCKKCGYTPSVITPHLFSFNSPEGACSNCNGFGRIIDIDWDLVVPNKSLSLSQGAIRPLENWEEEKELLFNFCKEEGIDIKKPWIELSQDEKDAILFGKKSWYGIKEIFDWLSTKTYKQHVRILLSRYRAYNKCPICKGQRFNNIALSYRLFGLTISQFYEKTIEDALYWLKATLRKHNFDKATLSLFEDLIGRLTITKEAGLGYLTLNRSSRTLSGGELSRLCLTKGVSTNLTETLYCIDEPSSGLHLQDMKGVAKVIAGLKKSNNTVIMVENDPLMKEVSDHEIALGPGSGKKGGQLIKRANERSTPFDIIINENKKSFSDFLTLKGASENNLKNITCHFPINAISCVCGVSGSGKSTLVEDTLYHGLLRLKGLPSSVPGSFLEIKGHEKIDKINFISQEPITKTPRACPGTYLKILNPIRKYLSETEYAKATDLTPGFFSLNVDGGRCSQCKGQGYEMIEMQFLPDLMMTCEKCTGKRFSQKALQVEIRGKNIADLLSMTLEEIYEFFNDKKNIKKLIKPALRLGLSHLLLGQPLNTLSTGEAQRLKIAKSLSEIDSSSNGLFIMDEPTKGLYEKEIRDLIYALKALKEKGHTIIVVEHDLQTILCSDWVIELGPKGGDKGGELIYEGTPFKLFSSNTPTGNFLNRLKNNRENPFKNREKIKAAQEDKKEWEATDNFIEIKGARHHNLKNIDIKIPKQKLVVITGVSGSGKSSLAFDLIYQEAQRRYLESLPSYLKQFIRLFERFDVDSIKGLSPSVAIEQKSSRGSSMSTVATLSEVAHYIRLFYTHCSIPHCPLCEKRMERASEKEIIEKAILSLDENALISVPRIRHRKGWHQDEIKRGFLLEAAFVRVDDKLYKKGENVPLSRYKEHNVDWLFGPFKKKEKTITTLLKRYLSYGQGTISIIKDGDERYFSTKYLCKKCYLSLKEPDPLFFSFHTSSGRCQSCLGLGKDSSGDLCQKCEGSRFSDEVLLWKIKEKNLKDLLSLEITDAISFFTALSKSPSTFKHKKDVALLLIDEILSRLKVMDELGLGYLSLDRSGDTLSGGEAQRIRLSTLLFSNLTGLTIVLDEPTIGLHPRDNRRLLKVLKKLRDRGNNIIVVEHDEDTISEADFIIDMGPEGGKNGGNIVFSGSFNELLKDNNSKTALYLKKVDEIKKRKNRINKDTKWIEIKGAKKHNLKSVNVKIPINALTFIIGVSGSGKTTLLNDIIHKALKGEKAPIKELKGAEGITGVLKIDHSPIGRTPRSCPATFVGLFSEIRTLFSRLKTSRIKGFGPSHFSFNTKEGMCPKCKGQGVIKQKLGLLPDVLITCESCGGKRFNPQVLDAKWKGFNISQVLSLTIDEAYEIFKTIPSLRRSLGTLKELGLGYLSLGQQSPTLSGGEAQRLKIAKELLKTKAIGKIYLFDEPSVGLHMEDIDKLSKCIHKLVDSGNTVIVVEHNRSLIDQADWIIEMGPEGGRHGGNVISQNKNRENSFTQ